MSKRIVAGALLGLAPLAATGNPPDSPEGPPVRVKAVVCAPGHMAGEPQAPFGYYQTQWRSFPVAQVEPPKPAPTQTAPAPAPKTSEKKIEPPAPPPKPNLSGRFATPTNTVVRADRDPIPVPHPASVGGRAAPKNEKGFASLRPEPIIVETQTTIIPVKSEPTPTPTPKRIQRPAAVDPEIRQIRSEDGVMRPDWPKLPAAKK